MNIPQIIITNVLPLFYIPLLFMVFILLKFTLIYRRFKHSLYPMASGNTFLKTLRNRGDYGEFLLFEELEKCNRDSKILTNVYLPSVDGSTTEIDVMMIDSTGIYVFESKNYSGWIFGDEKGKNWTQSLKGGKKTKFYNPVWQNKGHISALKKLLPEISPNLFYSFIVFSNRCELKKVTITQADLWVIKRNKLRNIMDSDVRMKLKTLNESEILKIYEELSKYTLVTETIKIEHINRIKKKVF